jgi:aminoacyl tRNA synthase complex-interacting multifunctional protein 1
MSFQACISQLCSPVKELVLSMTHDGSEYIGQTESDRAEVTSWIEKVARKEFVEESNIKVLCLELQFCIVFS